MAEWVGRAVELRRDEDDLGEIYVFDEAGRYIATAVNAERSGLSEQAFATEAKRQQGEWMKAQRAVVRQKQAAFRFEDARDALLRRDAEAAGKLVTLPVAAEAHTTPMLDSLTVAPPVLPGAGRMAAADRALSAPRVSAPASLDQRIAEADRVLADDAAGRPVDPAALTSARMFATSSEYRAAKILHGGFAPRASLQPIPQPKEASL